MTRRFPLPCPECERKRLKALEYYQKNKEKLRDYAMATYYKSKMKK